MIHLIICRWRVSKGWLVQLEAEHNVSFPREIREYPEIGMLREAQIAWCQAFSGGQEGIATVITDSDHIIHEFRCMVKEGTLDELKMTEVCSEGAGYFLVDYNIDQDGRFDTHPRLLETRLGQLRRLM